MKKFSLILLVILFSMKGLYAADDVPKDVIQVAQTWAFDHYQGTIGKGTPFYNSKVTISAWCFKVYRGLGESPSPSEIIKNIGELREKRLQAEYDLDQYFLMNDREKISETWRLIANLWASMRDAESYATIFVTMRPYPHVAMAYEGLPPYYVFLHDAKEKAKDQLQTSEVELERLYFLDPVNVYAEFKANNKSIYINMLLADKKPLSNLISPQLNSDVKKSQYFDRHSNLSKSFTTIEEIISGVPAYISSPSPSGFNESGYCRQVSAAMVLG